MKARFFAAPALFRAWLERHHASANELWVGFHRKDSGKPSLTWPESVDEALCFGWIDGLRRRLDEASYAIRFTPRLPTSHWSAVNLARMAVLIAAGRVAPAGLAAFERRRVEDPGAGAYAYERRDAARLTAAQQREFRAAPRAWAFFARQPPGYRRTATHWVTSAKREATQARRLAQLIACSAAGERIPQLRRTPR